MSSSYPNTGAKFKRVRIAIGLQFTMLDRVCLWSQNVTIALQA